MPEAQPTRAPRSIEQDAEAILHVGQLLSVDVDPSNARQAINTYSRAGAEPLERLAASANACGLRITPVRMSVADAVWVADSNQPILATTSEGKWIVIRRHGYFLARVSYPESPFETDTMGRHDLACLLGARNAKEPVDLGLVVPAKPMDVLGDAHHFGAAAQHGGGGHGHGGGNGHGHGHGHGNGHGNGHGMHPIRRFIALMRPETWDIAVIVVYSMITGLLYLALPLAINALVSNIAFGTASGPFQQALLVLGIVLFICLALGAVFTTLQTYMAEVIQRRLFVRLTSDLAYRLPRVDARAIDGVHAPELVNRFLDVVTMQKSTALILLTGVNLVLNTFIGLTVLAFYHPFLLTFSILLLMALAFIILVLGRGAIGTSIGESHCKYHVIAWLEELARCPRLFKGPGGYDLSCARADELARAYLRARRAHFRILIRQVGALLAVQAVASAVLLTAGGWLVIQQELTLGQLVAAEIIVSTIVGSIAKLGKQFESWYDTMASVDKIGHLIDLDTERENGDLPPPDTGRGMEIEAIDLGFSYHDGPHLFDGLNFRIEAGDRVALFGSQGSGISSMLDLLHGLRAPTSGAIFLDGHDIRGWRLESLRERAMLLRSTDIVSGTIAENLRLGRVETSVAELHGALERTGILRRILDLPEGLHTNLLAGGLPLSSRERIRLLFARALLASPSLLLVDEVLDGLDKPSREELAALVTDPGQSWTAIVSTRDEAVVQLMQGSISLKPPTQGKSGHHHG